MTGSFSVEPAHLRNVAPQFDSLADRTDAVLKTLRSSITSEGESWGADETGQSFGQSYVPSAELGQQGIELTAQTFEALGKGLRAVAAAFEATDTSNSANINGESQTLGGGY